MKNKPFKLNLAIPIKQEDWKYLNLKPLLAGDFHRPQAKPASLSSQLQTLISEAKVKGYCHLVFLDGLFSPELSDPWPSSLIKKKAPSSLTKSFSKINQFHQLNLLNAQPQSFNVVAELKLNLIFLNLTPGTAILSDFHYELKPKVSFDLRQTHLDSNSGQYFHNQSNWFKLASSSHLRFSNFNSLNSQANLFEQTYTQQASASRFEYFSANTGGALQRSAIYVDLAGQGAKCFLHGVYALAQQQVFSQFLEINHLASRTESWQNFQGLMADSSVGIFNGLVQVERSASQVVSHQLNKNLLLSEKSQAYSRPRLDIKNNDIECTHGSTTGPVDEQQLFYLQARGLTKLLAERQLSRAFLHAAYPAFLDPNQVKQDQENLDKKYFNSYASAQG